MFSKRKHRFFIKIQIARGKNARKCHTALLVACGRDTRTVPWLGGLMNFAEGEKMFVKNVQLTDRNQQVMMCM